MGATRHETETDTYSTAGKRLTNEAAKRLQNICIFCGEKSNYLLHLSLVNMECLSMTICTNCSKEKTVYELLELEIAQLLSIQLGDIEDEVGMHPGDFQEEGYVAFFLRWLTLPMAIHTNKITICDPA